MLLAVVFDFDGVIANSEPLHFRAFRDVLANQRVTLTEGDYYGRYLGFDDAGVFQAVAAEGGQTWNPAEIAELVQRKAAVLEQIEGQQSLLFPGAREAVRRLAASSPLAIASGALRSDITRVLRREHLSKYFAAVVSAEDTPASKPAPDPYALAVVLLSRATGLTLAPADCVAVEDSRWGLRSARTAGLRTVGVTHTYPAADLEDADLVISHLDQLTWEVLRTLDSPGPSAGRP
jgi:HAD superfamily hydrolase (TIGR01509 family)